MEFLKIDGNVLPTVTLIGKDMSRQPHRNIRRVCEDYILYIVTRGELFFCEDGREYQLQRGDCFLFEPEKLHYGTTDTVYNLLFIHFRFVTADAAVFCDGAAETDGSGNAPLLLPKRRKLSDDGLERVCLAAERAINSKKGQQEHAELLCALAVTEVLAEITRDRLRTANGRSGSAAAGAQRIREVTAYLGENYRRRLTGDIIERELSYNFDYLNQQCKLHTDLSIFRMLEKLRMDEAEILLQTTACSVGQIADAVGYGDAAYFSKRFKKHTGYSPLEYRKKQIG